ncbi:uncharacterized protein LOC122721821 [Manihot esculenta]|uniref:uncharacterized protein LOC122721821 n=1 Tax=Manihot esculenta TaxID=3983 RepID=UPI001CC53DA2|nr:uncharacterized protein LOC122721821 [Manihot esculenta]
MSSTWFPCCFSFFSYTYCLGFLIWFYASLTWFPTNFHFYIVIFTISTLLHLSITSFSKDAKACHCPGRQGENGVSLMLTAYQLSVQKGSVMLVVSITATAPASQHKKALLSLLMEGAPKMHKLVSGTVTAPDFALQNANM